MLKRIVVLCCIVLLLVSMAVPAFASTAGGVGYIRPAVEIDSITLLNGDYSGSVLDWPNNYASASSTFLSGLNDVFGYQSQFVGDAFETVLYLGSAFSFKLSCGDYFWSQDTVFMLQDAFDEIFRISSVTISGKRMNVEAGSSSYSLAAYSFTNTFSVNSRSVDFNDLIRKAIGNIEAFGSLVYIQDLEITVNIVLDDGLSSGTNIGLYFTVSQAKYPNYFRQWFNLHPFSFNFIVEEVQPGNMFDWLLSSVDAFLDFEIAPDFSFNELFWIVLVIGVILWFIKIIS
jgi:hypothetical protein